ncbi:hypothetical protein DRN74_02270 [Candidatus Micrarchaeota archaeon]|nr:MAG: hypothetical protein DRN74_02270 [Candidatus Micrarchaeota archaeon]
MNKNITILVLMLLFVVSTGKAITIGVSPGEIAIDNALKGGRTFREITVLNNNNFTVTVNVSITGDIRDFCTANETLFDIPSYSRKIVKIWIQPPKSTPSHSYDGLVTALIIATSETKKYEGLGMKIFVGASVKMNITVVGNESKSIKVYAVGARSTEYGLPMAVNYKIYNSGNVKLNPVIVLNLRKISKLTGIPSSRVFRSYNIDVGELEPNEIAEGIKKVNLGTDIKPDNYSLDIEVFKERKDLTEANEPVYNVSVVVEVLSPGFWTLLGQVDKFDVDYSKAGYPIKITASFRNTGKKALKAKMSTDIYEKDIGNKLVYHGETEYIEVDVGYTKNFTIYYTPEYDGPYVIKAKISYSASDSYVNENVKDTGWLTKEILLPGSKIKRKEIESNLYMMGFIVVIIIGLIIILSKLRK